MLTLNTKVDSTASIDGELILPYELREKSRLRATLTTGEDVAVFTVRGTVLRHGDLLRATLSNGEEVAVFTVRGTVLRNGDLLRGDDGRVVKVIAAAEATYRVDCATPHALLRCAFHLGNRHTQAQVGDGFLRIRKDPVLKDMLLGLNANVNEEQAPFEPESGAYGGGHHHHDDGHPHNPLAPIPLRQRIHRPSDKS